MRFALLACCELWSMLAGLLRAVEHVSRLAVNREAC